MLALPIVAEAQFTFTTNSGTITITGYIGTNSAAVIPGTLGGRLVTSIGTDAFVRNHKLTIVTIPDSVTNVGNQAFYGLTNLVYLFFSGDAPSVGSDGFFGVKATIYYRPGTTGWTATLGGPSTKLWNPLARAASVLNTKFGFDITGTTNLPFVIEVSTNFASGSWVPVETNTLASGSLYFSDPQWSNYSARFYRIRSP